MGGSSRKIRPASGQSSEASEGVLELLGKTAADIAISFHFSLS
jgi:hypothetical protein